MTKLKFVTISELPAVVKRVECKEFEYYGSKLTIAVYSLTETMQSLVLSVSDKETSAHVATRGYIGKAHINKIWEIYNSETFDPERFSVPNILRALYGIGIPESFWTNAREIIWSIPNISAMLKAQIETSVYQPVYEDDLSNKIFDCLKEDESATMSVMRNVHSTIVNYKGFPGVNDVICCVTAITDLYIDNVLIRFDKKEDGVNEARAEIDALPHDFVIPTSVDKLFEVAGDKFKGFRDTGKGYSRSVPVPRDENGVSLDKIRIPKTKTSDELTQDEMVALSVLEKLYGPDVAKLMVKGRELMSVTANEGNYSDEGSYFSAEILVEIKIAK